MQLKPEKIKPIGTEFTQITLNANSEFMELLEEARGLLGHKMPGASIAEILAEMMKLGLAELKKRKFKITSTSESSDTGGPKKASTAEPEKAEATGGVSTTGSKATEALSPASQDSDYISSHVKRAVSLRDQGRCVVPNPRTGKLCGSRVRLEYDHFPIPRAQGGPSTVENIRISCRHSAICSTPSRYMEEIIF